MALFAGTTQVMFDAGGQYCHRRIVTLRKGGYNMDNLAESVRLYLETLVRAE